MGIRSSFSKAVTQGWAVFNQEMHQGLAEHQFNAAAQAAQRRAKYIDSRITGDYARSTTGNKITFS